MAECAGIELPARGAIAAGEAATTQPQPPATSDAVSQALVALRSDIRTWQVISGVLAVTSLWLAYTALSEHRSTKLTQRELSAERGRVAAARKILL